MKTLVERHRAAYEHAVLSARAAEDAILNAADDIDPDQLAALEQTATEAVTEVERTRGNLHEAERTQRALDDARGVHIEPATTTATGAAGTFEFRTVKVGGEAQTYRPDVAHSFFRDLLASKDGDVEARDRLLRHDRETRDLSTTATAGGDFLPPLYLASLWANVPRAGRPFADACAKATLPPQGTAITVPKMSTGTTVATRSDNGAVSETDAVTATVSHIVTEIAGQQDIGRIVLMRSFPGLDQVIFDDLISDYDMKLDAQLLNGTGTAPQHRGINAVASINTVTYTDASPTAAELHPKLYDAIQKISTNRLTKKATHLVMHPRRAAWLASNLSSTFPLYQQGSLNQAAGTQDMGFAMSIAGLPVIEDANILTTIGAGTEDEIYAVVMSDLVLMEGSIQTRVFEEVGSGTGTVRLQVFAHSAFISARYASGITQIRGTGLIAPSF
ncbi:MAG: phage major capsid protein [Acidimicrobiales bacterium]